MFLCFCHFMSFDLDTLCCNHAGSGEQAGEPAEEAGDPDEEPTVGAKLGNAAGEFDLASGSDPGRCLSADWEIMSDALWLWSSYSATITWGDMSSQRTAGVHNQKPASQREILTAVLVWVNDQTVFLFIITSNEGCSRGKPHLSSCVATFSCVEYALCLSFFQ